MAEDGKSVRVAVEDDGPGITAEQARGIFDAFFTTRQPGQGTGLGLYLSREIVEKWGGASPFIRATGAARPSWSSCPKEPV